MTILLGILLIGGVSFALWQMTLTQTDKNTVSTSCFKLDFQEENDIKLENVYPITDEEGKVLTPYTFTITSLCESNAKYQINLEILNETTLEDVSILKVMLDDKMNLLSDKTVVSPTLEKAKTSYLLKTGYLRNGESKTFSLRLWMDYDTPPNLEYMNKTFLSKITITASYLDNLENTIASNVTSLNTGYDKNETFSIHLTSAKYDIVSVSDDGSAFEELEEQGKDITLEKIINTNGSHTLFVKDEAGNISEVLLNATKVDEKKPVARMNVTKNGNEIMIDANTSSDEETEITKYYFSKDNEHFYESTTSSYTFTNAYVGKATEVITNYFNNEIKQVYVKVEDKKGNVSDVISYEISSNFAYDNTADNNLRYIGKNPNNYVDFNGEKWRIIGVMNNVDDGTEKKAARIKLIRDESIGEYSWDNTSSNINGGRGINEWSQSKIMKLLNPGFESESANGSLYWNHTNGLCHSGENNVKTACDFTTIGLKEETKNFIEPVIWHTGSNDSATGFNNINTLKFYEFERGNATEKICTDSYYCNDNVKRTAQWLGHVGLISPSDFGFATSGGQNISRQSCLNAILYEWSTEKFLECKENNWLTKINNAWSINPSTRPDSISGCFFVYTPGIVRGNGTVFSALNILPVIYLKTSTNIVSGNGTKDNSYKLSLN